MSNDPDGETTQTMTEAEGGKPRSDGELAELAEARAQRHLLSIAYDREVLALIHERDDNARLRAVAAELLVALREATEHLRDWREPGVRRLMTWGALITRIEGEPGAPQR